MTPITKITVKEGVDLLSTPQKKMDTRTFKKWAAKLGFTKYAGTTPRKILYSREDIIKKWNQPIEEGKSKRGKIKI